MLWISQAFYWNMSTLKKVPWDLCRILCLVWIQWPPGQLGNLPLWDTKCVILTILYTVGIYVFGNSENVLMLNCWEYLHRQRSKHSAGVAPSPRECQERMVPAAAKESSQYVIMGCFPLLLHFSPMSSSSDFMGWQLRPWPLAFCPKLTALSYFSNPGKQIPWISTVGASSVPLTCAPVAGQDESPAALTVASCSLWLARVGKQLLHSWSKVRQPYLLLIGWDRARLTINKRVRLVHLRLCKKGTED